MPEDLFIESSAETPKQFGTVCILIEGACNFVTASLIKLLFSSLSTFSENAWPDDPNLTENSVIFHFRWRQVAGRVAAEPLRRRWRPLAESGKSAILSSPRSRVSQPGLQRYVHNLTVRLEKFALVKLLCKRIEVWNNVWACFRSRYWWIWGKDESFLVACGCLFAWGFLLLQFYV